VKTIRGTNAIMMKNGRKKDKTTTIMMMMMSCISFSTITAANNVQKSVAKIKVILTDWFRGWGVPCNLTHEI
jgi:hypothetical protein